MADDPVAVPDGVDWDDPEPPVTTYLQVCAGCGGAGCAACGESGRIYIGDTGEDRQPIPADVLPF